MANSFQVVDWLVPESLNILLNKLAVASYFNTDYNKEFERDFAVGDTVRVKYPQRYLIRDGIGYTPQAINRIYTTVTCNQIFGIDFEYDSVEKALRMERGEELVRKEYLEPAMEQIAQEIDSRAALFAYQNTNNIVSILGTDPTTFDATSAAARQRLVELACPQGGERCMIVGPSVMRALKNANISYFNPVTDISKMVRTGVVGYGDGFDWYESMSLYQHTAGTWQGTVSVSGANQSGSSLVINNTNGDTFNVGDVFSITNVNPVNPGTRRKVSSGAKQFVVTQALTGTGAGTDVLQISPSIFGPGSQYQNVDSLPANAATMTLFPGTSSPNGKVGTNHLALHRDAFALVGVKLETPRAVEIAKTERDPETGIAISFVRQFDAIQRRMINRFDVLLGFGKLYSDNCAVRVLGA